jgi:hypothetical protein
MKIIILLVCILLGSCDIINDTAESLGLKKKKSKTHISQSGLGSSLWAYLCSVASSSARSSSESSSCTSILSFPYTSCEGAELIPKNGCVSSSLTKGTIKYYKYQASLAETLSMVTDGLSSNSCLLAYKENKTVTTNSPISDLETNQTVASCQSDTSVSMSTGSYRCISVHSYCDNNYLLKLAGNISGLTVAGTGTANSNLPTWSQTTTTYTPITGTHVAIIGSSYSTVIPIGFNFTYFGQSFSNIHVSAEGLLNFNSIYLAIGPWWFSQFLDCDSSIQYSTTGTHGSQIFVVQWQKVKHIYDMYNESSTGQRLNYQVKFYESSNTIEFIYGPTIGTTSMTNYKGAIYIKSKTAIMDGKTGSTSTIGSYNASDFPASGTVYRFTP